MMFLRAGFGVLGAVLLMLSGISAMGLRDMHAMGYQGFDFNLLCTVVVMGTLVGLACVRACVKG